MNFWLTDQSSFLEHILPKLAEEFKKVERELIEKPDKILECVIMYYRHLPWYKKGMLGALLSESNANNYETYLCAKRVLEKRSKRYS